MDYHGQSDGNEVTSFPMGFSSGRLYAMVTVLLARAHLWPGPGVPVKLGTDMKL